MCYQGVVRNVFKIQKLSLGGQFRSFNRRVSDCSSSSVVQTEMDLFTSKFDQICPKIDTLSDSKIPIHYLVLDFQ